MFSSWRDNPYLRVSVLGWAHRILHQRVRFVVLGVFTLLVVAGLVVLAIWRQPPIGFWITAVATHAGWIMLIAAMHAGMQVARRRRELTQSLTTSWIAATPQGALTLRRSIALGVLAPLLIQLLLVLLLIVVLQALFPAHLPFITIASLLTTGTAAGAALGWRGGRSREKLRLPASRYVPKVRANVRQFSASFAALARWPIAKTFAWATPDQLRWPLFVVLLAPSAGTSLTMGLTLIASWTLVMYMTALLRATAAVSREAALWLRTTPINFARFATAVTVRSLVHQLLAGAALTTILVAYRLPVEQAVLACLFWGAFVALAYAATACLSYRAIRGAAALRARREHSA